MRSIHDITQVQQTLALLRDVVGEIDGWGSVSEARYLEAQNTLRLLFMRDAMQGRGIGDIRVRRMAGEFDDAIRGHEAFDAGITFAVERLAGLLGVKDWSIQEGSEDHDTDVENTILHVLKLGGVYDDETAEFARHPKPTQPNEVRKSGTTRTCPDPPEPTTVRIGGIGV